MKKTYILMVLLLLGLMSHPALAQTPCAAREGNDGDINFYCADPHVRATDLDAPNHHDVLPATSGMGGILTSPQAVTVGRTFFDPDSAELSTSDSVTVPAHFQEDGSVLSASCFGDYYLYWVDWMKELVDGDLVLPPGLVWTDVDGDGVMDSFESEDDDNDNVCDGCEWDDDGDGIWDPREDTNGNGVIDAGEDINANGALDNNEDDNGNGTRDWGEDSNHNGVLDKDTITFDIAAFVPSLPESCRKNPVSGPILVSDGDQDLADVHLEDNWPAMPDTLIAGTMRMDGTPIGDMIPDPVDSYFPEISVPTELYLPVNVTQGDFDGDGRLEAAILNLLPLNQNYWETFSALADDPATAGEFFKGLLPLQSFPYPGFMARADVQTEGPLFAVADTFAEGGGPTFTYNRENESTTVEPESPKNNLSQPMSIRAVDFSDAANTDLAVLHQRFYRLPEKLTGSHSVSRPTPHPYCTNLVAGEYPDPDLDINHLAVGMTGVYGEVLAGFELSTPIQSHLLGYLTSHKNDPGTPDLFQKQPSPEHPYRYCVGTGSIDFETGNFNGNDTPDLAVANFGGLGLSGPFAPGMGDPGGLALEVAGSVNFISDYAGGNNTESMNNLPIVPVPGQRHPVHPIDCATANIVGHDNGVHDVACTYGDAMGMHLEVARNIFYSVPDIIRSESVEDTCPPFGMMPAAPMGPGCGHADGTWFMYNTNAAASTLKPLEEWRCRALDETANPANPGEDLADAIPVPGGDPVYDLFECEGRADSITCPRLDRAHATKFEYSALYSFSTAAARTAVRAIWGGCTAAGPNFTCNIAGFEPNSWQCQEGGAGPAAFPLACRGTTVDNTVTQLPAPLTDAGAGTLIPPVERNMIFRCGYNFNLARDSEFCVYINNGTGGFSTSYPNHHCIDMAQYSVPRIVPEFPVNLVNLSFPKASYFGGPVCGGAMGGPLAANDCKTMKSWGNVSANGMMGLGVWPFSIDLADLCNTTGAPIPDGKADAILGLNNSHYVALICSKGGAEPYKSADVLFLDASTPRHKADMGEYLQDQIAKITAGTPLILSDYLKLSMGLMSGTSFVTVPKDPINGLNEFSEAETRRGIVAIQAFPWRTFVTFMNSLGGIGDLFGAFAGAGKMMAAPKNIELPAGAGGAMEMPAAGRMEMGTLWNAVDVGKLKETPLLRDQGFLNIFGIRQENLESTLNQEGSEGRQP